MKKILFIVLLTFVGFLFSCKNTNSSESTKQTESNSSNNELTEDNAATETEEPAATILYAWVDKLRVREQPTTKSEIVVEVKEGTSFTYLNEKTDYKERINLRGTLYNEPWLKVKMDDGKEGWVYGGAIKFYEPVVDASPSPYDACAELRKNGKYEAAFKCREKVKLKQLKKDARYVEENEEGITITLLSGEKVEFANDTMSINDELRIRNYVNYLPALGFFVLQNTLYEGGTYSLINDKSGKEIEIYGFPKPSPNSKMLFTSNPDVMAGFEYNGIEIYGFVKGKLEKLFMKEFENVEPHAPKWIDDETVEITLVPASDDKERKLKVVQVKRNERGNWSIED